jgi:hypothetical protein
LILWSFQRRLAFILHCTLLLKAAGQEKFAALVPASRAKVQKRAAIAGSPVKKNEP